MFKISPRWDGVAPFSEPILDGLRHCLCSPHKSITQFSPTQVSGSNRSYLLPNSLRQVQESLEWATTATHHKDVSVYLSQSGVRFNWETLEIYGNVSKLFGCHIKMMPLSFLFFFSSCRFSRPVAGSLGPIKKFQCPSYR